MIYIWTKTILVVVVILVSLVLYSQRVEHCSIDPRVSIPWIDYSFSLMDVRNTNNNILRNVLYTTCDVYSDTYEIARKRFLHAVHSLESDSYRLVSLNVDINDTNVDTMDTITKLAPTENNINDIFEQSDNPSYTIDIAIIPGSCDGIAVHISGTHGVEGYAGSAIQIAYLQGLAKQQQQLVNPPQTSINLNRSSNSSCSTLILVHAFNPYGMAFYRRVNENNVDLNRNGLVTESDWSKVLNRNHYNTLNYETIVTNHLLLSFVPTTMSSWIYKWFDFVSFERYVFSWIRLIFALIRFGIPNIKAALVGGQYHEPDGLFYGGGIRKEIDTERDNVPENQHRNEPSLYIFREWMDNFLQERRHTRRQSLLENSTAFNDESISWIDVHTGLGPMGVDTLLFGSTMDKPNPNDIQHWFPHSLVSKSTTNGTNNTSEQDTQADAVQQGYERVVGYTMDYYYTTLFHNRYNTNQNHLFMVQEFGTVSPIFTGHALVVEHVVRNYYDRLIKHYPMSIRQQQQLRALSYQFAKDTLGSAFYPQRTAWRVSVLKRGIDCLQQAIRRSSYYSQYQFIQHDDLDNHQNSDLPDINGNSQTMQKVNHNNAKVEL